MSVRVAVYDPLPIFAKGMTVTLSDAGFRSDAPEDLLAWVPDEGHQVILLTVRTPHDWALLTKLRRLRSQVLVVALLDQPSHPGYLRALTAGAVAAVPRAATPGAVLQVIEAAVRGDALLPIEVVRSLATGYREHDPATDGPSQAEIDWLRHLAGGATVADLARRVGYSERMMFRLLRGLYGKLNVDSRTEAIMFAHDQGWL